MALVFVVDKGDEVLGVGVDLLHEVGRFGDP
jgi:hypothetical protein